MSRGLRKCDVLSLKIEPLSPIQKVYEWKCQALIQKPGFNPGFLKYQKDAPWGFCIEVLILQGNGIFCSYRAINIYTNHYYKKVVHFDPAYVVIRTFNLAIIPAF